MAHTPTNRPALDPVDIPGRVNSHVQRPLLVMLSVLTLAACGCEGRKLVDDNPVFGMTPPRRSLVNSSGRDPGLVARATGDSKIRQVSLNGPEEVPLRGNTIVAEINGRPLFVDDLVGSIRVTVEANEGMTEDLRQQILKTEIRKRLEDRVLQEIAVQALEAKIPEEQREKIQGHIEEGFQQFVEGLKKQHGAETDAQFDEMLAREGMSIGLLRESFVRMQMVNGYVESVTEETSAPEPDRRTLLNYYQDHIAEFTPQERIRWQEIRIEFAAHGGRAEAEKRMTEVVQVIQSGSEDFGRLAKQYSDSLSAEQEGNKGWLSRGGLADQEVEAALFELQDGGVSKVFVRDGYFAVYRVARHEYAVPGKFEDVQDEIKAAIVKANKEASRRKVLEDLRANATVRTIFDDAG